MLLPGPLFLPLWPRECLPRLLQGSNGGTLVRQNRAWNHRLSTVTGAEEAKLLEGINNAVNIFFYFELLIHAIVHGFYFRPNAYLRQERFTLDWVVVACTLFEAIVDAAGLMSDFPSLKPLRSIRALRAFRFLNEVIAILDTLAVVPMSNIFKLPFNPAKRLRIQVYDHDDGSFNSDDYIGKSSVRREPPPSPL